MLHKMLAAAASTRLGGVMAVFARYPTYRERIRRELEDRLPSPPTEKQIRWCFWDYVGFRFKYKGSWDTDYFGIQLYRKSDFVRRESFATRVRFEWRNAVNDPKYKCFDDKRWFYAAFSEYLHRDWKLIDADTTYDEYLAFVNGKPEVFVKKPDSGGGKDVRRWVLDSGEKKKALFDLLKKEPQIIEEPVIQCKELHSFSNDTSVNTLRIITIVDESGKPHVARALFRMGRENAAVDNFSSGGMGASIDVDTGVIFQPAIDKKGREYIFHPDSKKQIVGFLIPDWEGYKEFALELAAEFPTVRYVGWDIVKDMNGNYLAIEGNRDAGADLMETGLLYGLLPVYDSILHMGGNAEQKITEE